MSKKEPILVSACLLGFPCRYDGATKPCPAVTEQIKTCRYIPICPEMQGGLPIPRPPAEIQGENVVNREGRDVTAQYRAGAEIALHLAKRYGCKCAILKEKSPSCGRGEVYDGTFTKTLRAGNGITAALLEQNGIRVMGESEWRKERK